MTQDVERSVRERYARAAEERAPALCCPVDYDRRWLAVIPPEILERDYGCGDPSRHLRPGEVVLDLGSGGGKIAYIAAQVVGASGRVLGIDMNDAMLALARKHRRAVGDALGFHNVEFRKGRIQDLALDVEALEARLAARPVSTADELAELEAWCDAQRRERPLVPDASVDVVVSNCVLNLVRPADKERLFREMHRVLARHGRVVISDIVSDEDVPQELQDDPELWSGCVSGAFREDRFLEAFERAGFHGMRVLARDEKPWQTVEGIEFRALTVEAFKGKAGPCLERLQAVMYKGPWRAVTDDDGHTLVRGKRMAVCDKTFRLYTSEPYRDAIVAIPPHVEVPLDAAGPFACDRDQLRSPRESKGREFRETKLAEVPYCAPGTDCC